MSGLANRGGMVIGPAHPQGGVNFVLEDTGRILQEEGMEINIPLELRQSTKVHTFKGNHAKILNQILQLAGLSITDKVKSVRSGDVVICVRSAWDDAEHTYTGTVDQILHQINTSNGCKPVIKPVSAPLKAKRGGKVPKGVIPRVKDWQTEDPTSPRWQKKRIRIQELSNGSQRLRMNVSRDIQSDDERTALTALVVAVMDRTAERIGNNDSADNGHFGVTGFRKKHISVVGNTVHLDYMGKSGMVHAKSFSDVRIAKALKKAIKNSPGKFLFETSDGFRIKSDRVNRYLEPFHISAKDLRGYNANRWIIELLNKADGKWQLIDDGKEKGKKERKKIFNKALKEVALRVGHGKGTLKKHYMIPELPIEYIEHARIINMKNLGYYKEGGPLGEEADPSVEEKISQRLKERQKSKEFKDTGIATYTRKYQAAYDIISSSDLADIEKDNVTAYKLIEKSKIWPLYNVNELKEKGNTSGAAYLKVKCREFLSARPLDTKEAREVYVRNIEKLRSDLESIKTALDVKNYLYEFADSDKMDLGDLSSIPTVSYISTSYIGNLKKHSSRQVEEYIDNIFGKKFYNFCRGKSDTSKRIYAEAFLYESYAKSMRDAYINTRYQTLQTSLKRYNDLKDKIEESASDKATIQQLIKESGLPYYDYDYSKAHVMDWIIKYTDYLNAQTKEKIEATISKAYTVREEDWSWSGTEKKAAVTKDEEGKPRKPQNIFEKYGIEIPKVLKRTPLEYVKRTGGLEVGDISTKAVLDNYGFKNIIYGNYVNDVESKEHTKHILGAMLDMVEICNIDIKDINKLGGLDINIGSTGCGPFSAAAACYFPSLKAINLTKKTGDGSLGHEWSHYLDNILAEGAEKRATNIQYATLGPAKSERVTMLFTEYKNWLLNGGSLRKITVIYYPQKKFLYRILGETLPQAIEAIQRKYAAYKDYKNFNSNDLVRYYGYLAYKLNDNKPIKVELETRATQFYIATSTFVPSDYFLSPKEMFARAFEGWLEYKLEKMGRSSNYLVDITSGMGLMAIKIPRTEWCYPAGEDVIWLDDWFERLFSAIRVDYNIKPFTWGTKNRVDEYTDYKNAKNEKVDAGVEVSTDGTVTVSGGDNEIFEKGYAFRMESLTDAKGENRSIYRLLTQPYGRGDKLAAGGVRSDVFIFPLKYFTDQKSGYGIADGMKDGFPNIMKTSGPTVTIEEAKKEAIDYFKSYKEQKPKPMTQESDYQPELFIDGGVIGMPEEPYTWESIKKFFEGILPGKLPQTKDRISLTVVEKNFERVPFESLNIKPIPYKIKDIDEPLKNIVGTDELRPAMMGIYYDSEQKQKVATNAHILVIIKDKAITAAKLVDPLTGNEIKDRYPNYMAVIPRDNAYKIHLTESEVNNLIDKLNGIVRAKRFLQSSEDHRIAGKIIHKDIEMYVNPVFLLTVIIALKQYGATSIDLEFSTPNMALMVIDGRHNGNKGLVMPIMWKDDFIYVNILDGLAVQAPVSIEKEPQPVKKKIVRKIPTVAPSDRKKPDSLHSCAVRLGRKGGIASAKERSKMGEGGVAGECGCFNTYLKKENPDLCEKLVTQDINNNPDLRTEVDAAYQKYQGGSI